MVRNSYKLPGLNEDFSRNILNVDYREYNCAGFALGTFNWYVPCKSEDEFIIDYHSTLEDKEKLYVKHLLKEFNGSIRRIQSLDKIQKDEYGIALKIGFNDFHFVKIMSPTIAYEKRGNTKIRRFPIEDIMSRYWRDGYYASETFLFAKKKDSYPKPKKAENKAQEDQLASAC